MNIMNIHQTIQDIKQCQSANLWEINVWIKQKTPTSICNWRNFNLKARWVLGGVISSLPIASLSHHSRMPEEPRTCWYDLFVAANDRGLASDDSACCDVFLHQEQPKTKKLTIEIKEACQCGINRATCIRHLKKEIVLGMYWNRCPQESSVYIITYTIITYYYILHMTHCHIRFITVVESLRDENRPHPENRIERKRYQSDRSVRSHTPRHLRCGRICC
jgi:hypothetical protein